MCRSFIVPEGANKAKKTSAVFLILKKQYLPAGSIIICSIAGSTLFASTKTPQVCVFPGEIMTSSSQSSLMSCRWEVYICLQQNGKGRIQMIYSSQLLDPAYYFLLSLQYYLISCCTWHPSWKIK